MELKEIINTVSKYLKLITAIALIGGLVGTALYYALPKKYYASGSLVIFRTIENGEGRYFTYEGYYGQQTAQAFTNTVAGLLESLEIKRIALEEKDMPVNEQTIRKVSRMIRIKKASPQIITVITTGYTSDEALQLWNSVADNTIGKANEINKTGDPNLQIAKIDRPVVKEQFSNLWINTLTGISLGLVGGIILSFFINYLKDQKK